MATHSEEIAAKMGLDSTGFQKGLRSLRGDITTFGSSVQQSFGKIGATIAGVFTAGKLVDFGKSILSFASQLQDAAERLNVSAEFLQGFRHAASQSGIGAEKAADAMAKLSQNVGEAANQGGNMLKTFTELGISLFTTTGTVKSLDQLFLEVADSISKIPEPTQRTRIAMELFGKGGSKLLPILQQGSKGFEQLSSSINKLSSEDVAKLSVISNQFAALGTRFKVVGGSLILQFMALFSGKLDEAQRHARNLTAELLKIPGILRSIPGLGFLEAALPTIMGGLTGFNPASKQVRQPSGQDPRVVAFAQSLAALDKEAQSRANALRMLTAPGVGADQVKIQEQTDALVSVDKQIAELIRKATQEGLVVQPKMGR